MNNRYILLISCILLTTISSLLFGSLAITPTEHFAKHHKKHHNKHHPKHHKPTDNMGKLVKLISPMFKFINKNIPKAEKAAKKMSLGGNMMMNPVNTITAANSSSEEGGYEISPPPGTYYDAGTNSYYYYDQSAAAPDQSIPLPTVPQPLSVNSVNYGTPAQLLNMNYGTPSK